MVGLYGETRGAKWQGFGTGDSLELAEGTVDGSSHSVMDPPRFVEKVLYLSTFHVCQDEEYLCVFGLCYLG